MAELNIGGNYLAGLSGGLQAGQAIRGIQDQNMLREIGPQLAAGDANALAQYAQIDPIGAMQLERQRAADARSEQQFNQTTELNAARLEQIKADSARAAAAEARRLTEEQRAAEAAQIDSALASASAAYQQGPEAFEAWKTQNAQSIIDSDLDPAQITYDSFPMVAAGLVGAREGLTAGAEFAEGLQPEAGYRQVRGSDLGLTGEEAGAMFNVGPDNKITRIGGGGTNVTTNVNSGGVVDPFQEKLSAAEGDQFVTFLEQGPEASRNIARLDQLEGLLQNVPTGLGASFKAALGEYGIPTEGLEDIQAAQALINQMVPAQRPPGSGEMSNADLALFKQSVPRLINQPGGNKLIIQTIREINEYDARLASIAQQAASGQIDRAQARQMVNSIQNPLEGFGARVEGFGRDSRQQDIPPAPPIPEGADITPADWQRAWERMSPEDRRLFQ